MLLLSLTIVVIITIFITLLLCLFIHKLICLVVYLFTYLFIYSFIDLFFTYFSLTYFSSSRCVVLAYIRFSYKLCPHFIFVSIYQNHVKERIALI